MMKKYAILFAGQGAQFSGMGQDFYQKYPEVRNLYSEASSILGYDLTSICFEERPELNQTLYTQPAIVVTSLAIYRTLMNEYQVKPEVIAGFSLGEYSALYASGVFSLANTLSLVKSRALLMEKAAIINPGAMAAVIGMDRESLQSLCDELGNIYIANYNSPNQLVVSGSLASVEKMMELAPLKGAKRVIKLNVSGAFHTPYMKEAANELYQVVLNTPYNHPHTQVMMNCNADYLSIDKLPELLKKQIMSPVYFEDMVKKMIEDQVDLFIEIGPGKVLKGLIQRINPTKVVIAINNLDDLLLLKEVK